MVIVLNDQLYPELNTLYSLLSANSCTYKISAENIRTSVPSASVDGNRNLSHRHTAIVQSTFNLQDEKKNTVALQIYTT